MKLSPKQFQAYMKLDYKEWKSAYETRSSLSTLRAIVKKGYAEEEQGLGAVAFPRSCIYFRKTDKPI